MNRPWANTSTARMGPPPAYSLENSRTMTASALAAIGTHRPSNATSMKRMAPCIVRRAASRSPTASAAAIDGTRTEVMRIGEETRDARGVQRGQVGAHHCRRQVAADRAQHPQIERRQDLRAGGQQGHRRCQAQDRPALGQRRPKDARPHGQRGDQGRGHRDGDVDDQRALDRRADPDQPQHCHRPGDAIEGEHRALAHKSAPAVEDAEQAGEHAVERNIHRRDAEQPCAVRDVEDARQRRCRGEYGAEQAEIGDAAHRERGGLEASAPARPARRRGESPPAGCRACRSAPGPAAGCR